MSREKYIQLLNSGELDKAPQTSDLLLGEVAVNHNAEHPFLAFKNTNDTEVFKVGTLTQELGESEYHTISQKTITDVVNDRYTKEEVDTLIDELVQSKINAERLSFYTVEEVTVTVDEEEYVFAANSNAEISVPKGSTLTITPTSNNSILRLDSYPGALTWYDWLEGVQLFDGILFDMNDENTYPKWNHQNDGKYHVQEAQYVNCIFWSDSLWVANKNDYYLHKSFQMPLCYSQIADNTYKMFGECFAATSNPNWANQAYKDSFAKGSGVSAFAYNGATTLISWDDMEHNVITLPADCKGMFFASQVTICAGIFDAMNTTTFGAKQGTWKDAFNLCYSLRQLYIKNLNVSINVSWSKIEQSSLNYILTYVGKDVTTTDEDGNEITERVITPFTISVSPYTYYRLTEENKTLAEEKGITIELIEGNCEDDSRFNDIVETVNIELDKKANADDVYTKTEVDGFVDTINTTLDTKASLDYVDTSISNLVNLAPAELDTLGELAEAITNNKDVITALNEAIATKANASDVYTKDEVYTKNAVEDLDEALANGLRASIDTKADAESVYTKTEVDNLLSSIDLSAEYYTETEIDTMLATINSSIDTKANSSDVYTKTEVDTKLDDKANVDDVYDKATIDGMLSAFDLDAEYYTKDEVDTLDANLSTTLKTYVDEQIAEYITNILNTPT